MTCFLYCIGFGALATVVAGALGIGSGRRTAVRTVGLATMAPPPRITKNRPFGNATAPILMSKILKQNDSRGILR